MLTNTYHLQLRLLLLPPQRQAVPISLLPLLQCHWRMEVQNAPQVAQPQSRIVYDSEEVECLGLGCASRTPREGTVRGSNSPSLRRRSKMPIFRDQYLHPARLAKLETAKEQLNRQGYRQDTRISPPISCSSNRRCRSHTHGPWPAPVSVLSRWHLCPRCRQSP